MAKELFILAVSVVTLFVAGFIAYSVNDLDLNAGPQEATAEKDYSGELESIQASLNSMNKGIENLESDTLKELERIKAELEEVKALKDASEAAASIPEIIQEPFGILLDNSVYQKDEDVTITTQNMAPQQPMRIELYGPTNELVLTKNVFSDVTGTLVYALELPATLLPGDYKIQTKTGSSTDTKDFKIVDGDSPIIETPEPITGLTVELEKDEFEPGEMIKVTGVGKAGKSIGAELSSPTSEIFSAHSSTTSDGTYVLIFVLPSDAQHGNWNLKVTLGSNVEKISFRVDK